ncbi:Tn3 family transposase [Streptomyces sp. NBC_00989]|uniref:Tn3 family transposase n=1 Tax=Streptomyces sp. NBC_00989 TaxID=2903705 RepID=UPI0038663123|nr:transposase [Streptomyces sp. NBC_00989]
MRRCPGTCVEALTRSRLVHVDQYYLRSDTIAAANAALIEAQAQVPIVKFWGQGLRPLRDPDTVDLDDDDDGAED